jgi:hypothetical protein
VNFTAAMAVVSPGALDACSWRVDGERAEAADAAPRPEDYVIEGVEYRLVRTPRGRALEAPLRRTAPTAAPPPPLPPPTTDRSPRPPPN